jgi:hypothetical protein
MAISLPDSGCTGGLGVRSILVSLSDDLGAMLGARIAETAGRVILPTGRRADFDAFGVTAPALLAVLAVFLSDRPVALADRPAVLVEWLLMPAI